MNETLAVIHLLGHTLVVNGWKLVGYAGGLERKELLLKLEGALDSSLLDM